MATKKDIIKRPFTTDYGLTKGHCVTAKGAMKSAACYLIDNDQRHCTIEGPGGARARVYFNLGMGLAIVPVGRGAKDVEHAFRLRRVA